MLRSSALSGWLGRFAENANLNVIERGIELYRNRHVWDYHTSRTGIHATIEDHQSTFFQVSVTWNNDLNQAIDAAAFLPDPAGSLNMRCNCGAVRMPCRHIAAAVIYWLSELDRKQKGRQPSMVLPEADESDYDKKLSLFRKLSKEKVASFADFEAGKLHQRPDLQKEISRISLQVMREMRDLGK